MRKIECPLECDTKTIIDEINNFPRVLKREERIEKSKITINSLSEQLNEFFKRERLDVPSPLTELEITKDDMVSLYKDKFVQSHFYNELVAPYRVCPICGIRYVNSVDHYLPKSIYYLYSVTPFNLVPLCLICNKAKLESDPQALDYHIYHPYFDQIDETSYLKMDFYFDEYNNFVPVFSLIGTGFLKEIYESNYKLFNLKRNYEEEAVKIFNEGVGGWKNLFEKFGELVLIEFLTGCMNSNSKNPIVVPFYKSLKSSIDILINFFKKSF